MATSLGVIAISNTSTYIQGGLEVYITDNGSSKTVDAYLYYRRTNTYSGRTYTTNCNGSISLGSQTTSATYSPSIPGNTNAWQGWYVHASRTFEGASRELTISWSSSGGQYFTGSGSTTITIPSSYTSPSTPSVSVISKTHNSVTLNVNISSYGLPSSIDGRYIEGAILGQNSYGASYRYKTAKNTTASQITIDNNSSASPSSFTIEGNHKYWFGGFATNTQKNKSVVTGTVYTPCPPLTALDYQNQTYDSYNSVSATLSFTRATDGNEEERTGYFRYSTDNKSTWSNWESIGLLTSTTGTITTPYIPTNSTVILQFKINTPNGGDSEIVEETFDTLPDHIAPTFANFTYVDSNTSSVAVTGNSQIFIQNQSVPRITISTENKAVGNDGVEMSSYTASLSGNSNSKVYSEDNDVVIDLPVPTIGETAPLVVSAIDALNLATTVTKNVTICQWQNPTLVASIERLNNFDSQSTLKISGTWSPITISGTNKNTLSVQYRTKKTSESSWGAWNTRPTTTDSTNWTTTDYITSLDNQYQWDIEVKVSDAFSTETVSLSLSVGIPLFFIGDDGRVSIGGKPTKYLQTGEKGILEVNGRIFSNGKELGLDAIYPVGSIYMSATLDTVTKVQNALGGTWVAWGAGRVPVGVDTTQTEFNTVSKTGGEKTHKLTISEMPSHRHYVAHLHANSGTNQENGAYWGPHNNEDQNSGYTGGDQAHNNLQPYITCYMYKRTA